MAGGGVQMETGFVSNVGEKQSIGLG